MKTLILASLLMSLPSLADTTVHKRLLHDDAYDLIDALKAAGVPQGTAGAPAASSLICLIGIGANMEAIGLQRMIWCRYKAVGSSEEIEITDAELIRPIVRALERVGADPVPVGMQKAAIETSALRCADNTERYREEGYWDATPRYECDLEYNPDAS